MTTNGNVTEKKIIKNGWLWIPLSVSALFIVVIFYADINRNLFYYFNQWPIYSGRLLWANLTIFGDTMVAAVLFLPWMKKRPDMVWSLLFAGILAFILSQGLKSILSVPRPLGVLDPDSIILIGPGHKHRSFPSGHATTIFTFSAVTILYIRKNLYKTLMFIFAFVVGLSRVVVGVHWPLDILGGLAAGWLSAWFGISVYQFFRQRLPQINILFFSTILIISVIVLIFFYNTKYSSAYYLKVTIGLSTLANMAISLKDFILLSKRKE